MLKLSLPGHLGIAHKYCMHSEKLGLKETVISVEVPTCLFRQVNDLIVTRQAVDRSRTLRFVSEFQG